MIGIIYSAPQIQVIEFGTETREENFFEIQPNPGESESQDFSICFRCKFWTWGPKVIFDTNEMVFALREYKSKLGDFYLKNSPKIKFSIVALKVSPNIWNSFCIIYNSTITSVMIVINNQKESHNHSVQRDEMESLKSKIMIGSYKDFRFSGQISDFNIWDRTLDETEVTAFMSTCSGVKVIKRFFFITDVVAK
jgi:Concanavalin A-like lectin/glucanases superfamily